MKFAKFAAVAALTLGMAVPAFAQQRQPRAPGRVAGSGVEAALRMREQLKLTDAQVSQLESLRQQMVAQRQAEARDMIDLRSRAAAGQLERDAVRKQMQERRESMRKTMEQRRESIEKILTEEQRQQIRSQMRKHQRGMKQHHRRRN